VRSFRRKQPVHYPGLSPTTNDNIKYIGVTLPFNNPNGIFNQSITNVSQVLSNLRNLLLTAKGERYMLPEFGTEIRLILFENISSEEGFVNEIKKEIASAIKTWMPFLNINQLDVELNITEDGRVIETDHAVGIKLVVQIQGTDIYLPIQILISTTGNLTLTEAIYNG
jgi:phage baseplate assembly protein W